MLLRFLLLNASHRLHKRWHASLRFTDKAGRRFSVRVRRTGFAVSRAVEFNQDLWRERLSALLRDWRIYAASVFALFIAFFMLSLFYH